MFPPRNLDHDTFRVSYDDSMRESASLNALTRTRVHDARYR
jgi:hypothetical protein